MKKPFLFYSLLVFSFLAHAQEKYTQYVDPMIGTGGHGHTFPGVTTPFGMVQVSPDTRVDGSWDGCSGYHNSDSIIYGFSHTHLSGTGCSDYGDMMVMPMMGEPSFDKKVYASSYSHSTEKASPGYYAVKLNDDNIDVELTASCRVGLHKYTFNKEGKASFIVDLNHRDKLLAGVIKIIDERTIEVYRCSEAWAKNQKLYARIVFSKPWLDTRTPVIDETVPGYDPWNRQVKSAFVFNVKKGETVMVKVALSPVTVKGARLNMITEIPGFDFEKVKAEAEAMWNKELGKIEVSSLDETKKKIFYTALYHCMIHPSTAMDVDSLYRGMDDQIHKAEGYTQYSVFSLWDTFRALHPLFTIIDRRRTADFIRTFIAMYEQGGRLPVWELSANETDCMIGYHSVSVMADAMTKKIGGFDYKKAYEAAKHSAELDRDGLKALKTKGLISMDDEGENVSKTLEYSYDDWCIAQMAQLLKDEKGYAHYMERSQYWKNVYDSSIGFARPKQNGGWMPGFDPRRVDNNFTEANSWQYTFFVPHDIPGMSKMMGGDKKLEEKLDSVFTTSSKTTGREQADITGLIGQYAHGNEPSHQIAYLYNYTDHPWKAQMRIHEIVKDFYKASPDGLIGNEDCGQMSAWYVMSAIGLYQVCPGNPEFEIGTPAFESVKIHLESGKIFTITAENFSEKNYYTVAAFADADSLPMRIPYAAFSTKKELKLEMQNKVPAEGSYVLALQKADSIPFLIVPVFKENKRAFSDSLLVSISSTNPNCTIRYTFGDSIPNDQSRIFSEPFYIKNSSRIKALVMDSTGHKSFVVTANYHLMPVGREIFISSKYNPQYTAGGEEGIIDGLRGGENWRKGDWQGYQGQDFEAMISLGTETTLTKLGAGFLQDSRSWILFPKRVTFEISMDGKNFTPAATIENTVPDKDNKVQIKDFVKAMNGEKAKFIKVKASNYGALPTWHQGAGGEAFIFVDEIIVE